MERSVSGEKKKITPQSDPKTKFGFQRHFSVPIRRWCPRQNLLGRPLLPAALPVSARRWSWASARLARGNRLPAGASRQAHPGGAAAHRAPRGLGERWGQSVARVRGVWK